MFATHVLPTTTDINLRLVSRGFGVYANNIDEIYSLFLSIISATNEHEI